MKIHPRFKVSLLTASVAPTPPILTATCVIALRRVRKGIAASRLLQIGYSPPVKKGHVRKVPIVLWCAGGPSAVNINFKPAVARRTATALTA